MDEQIELDLPRTFPGHLLLSDPEGIHALRQVLVAYSRRQPVVGYVQGMGFMAALLLVVTEDAEMCFWCLAAVVEYRLPRRFLEGSLLGLRLEQALLPATAPSHHHVGHHPLTTTPPIPPLRFPPIPATEPIPFCCFLNTVPQLSPPYLPQT